jgi:Holliday junction resolvase RusA-like endonuclease
MPLPLEFIVIGSPMSNQARRRKRVRAWTQYVQNFAGLGWGVEQPFVGDVMVTITYLYNRQSNDIDVDNIPKPILDALKGLVYSDDSQVTDLLCRKRRYGLELRMPNSSSLLRSTHERTVDFVHVSVENAPKSEVSA